MSSTAPTASPEAVPLQSIPLNQDPQKGPSQNAPPGQYAYNQVPQQQPIRYGAQPARMSSSSKKIVFIGLGIYCAVAILIVIIFLVVFFTVFNKAISEFDKLEQERKRHEESYARDRFSNTNW